MLRNQWHSVNYPKKRAYVGHNPLVAARIPDLDNILCRDFETETNIAPSNVIIRDFCGLFCRFKVFMQSIHSQQVGR